MQALLLSFSSAEAEVLNLGGGGGLEQPTSESRQDHGKAWISTLVGLRMLLKWVHAVEKRLRTTASAAQRSAQLFKSDEFEHFGPEKYFFLGGGEGIFFFSAPFLWEVRMRVN